MVIAIDGPAGVGKSSISKIIADKLGIYYLNSGEFYRAITYKVINLNSENKDNESIIKIAKSSKIEVKNNRIILDGEDVQDKLHTPELDLITSKISSIVEVRDFVNDLIHKITSSLSVVAEGRDMTTVVFPDAEYKFYFDANPEIRASRRYNQNNQKGKLSDILSDINKRDLNDMKKEKGALKIADDSIYIDTSYLTIDEVCEKVLLTIKK